MYAAIVESFEHAPRYAEFKAPIPAPDEMIVNVRAAGLHNLVRALAAGKHYGSTGELPFIPGIDGVGTLADGSRAYFLASRSPFGTMAEQSITTKTQCISVPDALDDALVAGICNAGMSAWVALKVRAKFVAGESVFILGATGVSGRIAVQIAKRLGARRVIAAGRNEQELAQLRSLGADAIVQLKQSRPALVDAMRDAWQADGVDVVLDYLWGEPAEALLEAASTKGLHHAAPRVRYVEIGQSAGPKINLLGATLRSTGLELLGSGFGSASTADIMRSISEFLASAAEKPYQFELEVAPLAEIEQRWQRPTSGRLVFRI